MRKLIFILFFTFAALAVGDTRPRYVSSKFTATAYCLRGKTASGATVRHGLVAADPRVLPIGSRIKINNQVFVVADTGGKIKGKRIDIWMLSCRQARQYGVKTIDVTRL